MCAGVGVWKRAPKTMRACALSPPQFLGMEQGPIKNRRRGLKKTIPGRNGKTTSGRNGKTRNWMPLPYTSLCDNDTSWHAGSETKQTLPDDASWHVGSETKQALPGEAVLADMVRLLVGHNGSRGGPISFSCLLYGNANCIMCCDQKKKYIIGNSKKCLFCVFKGPSDGALNW